MTRHLRPALAVLLFVAGAAYAADSPPGSPAPAAPWGGRAPQDPDLGDARARIAAKDWPAAAEILQKAVARNPANPEYHNLLAYSIRHTASPDMDVVFKHYGEALRLDPKHKGAHEYIGEAYLMVGNPAKAREHLAALDKLCFFTCEEYRDLKKAIERYESQKK
jgi:tetratricopeptide (TPR) repeat protein